MFQFLFFFVVGPVVPSAAGTSSSSSGWASSGSRSWARSQNGGLGEGGGVGYGHGGYGAPPLQVQVPHDVLVLDLSQEDGAVCYQTWFQSRDHWIRILDVSNPWKLVSFSSGNFIL